MEPVIPPASSKGGQAARRLVANAQSRRGCESPWRAQRIGQDLSSARVSSSFGQGEDAAREAVAPASASLSAQPPQSARDWQVTVAGTVYMPRRGCQNM